MPSPTDSPDHYTQKLFSDLAGPDGGVAINDLLLGKRWLGIYSPLETTSFLRMVAPEELHPKIDNLLMEWLSKELGSGFDRERESKDVTEKQYAEALYNGIGLLSALPNLPNAREFIRDHAEQMLRGQTTLPRFASKDHVATLLYALSIGQQDDRLTPVWDAAEESLSERWQSIGRLGRERMPGGQLAANRETEQGNRPAA